MELKQRIMVAALAVIAVTIGAQTFGNSQVNAQAQNETITAQPGNVTTSTSPLSNLPSSTPEAQPGTTGLEPSQVKIVSKCVFNNASCARLADQLFRVQPYIFVDNRLDPLGFGFPASGFGRTITFQLKGDPTQYVIKQDIMQPLSGLFNTITSYSPDCENQIRPGESKVCTINTYLYLR
jgi:hypothetical protein